MKKISYKRLFFIGIFTSLFATANSVAACQYGPCWNAIAVGPDWAAGYATDRATAADADSDARRECGGTCDVVEVFDGGCGSLATSHEGASYLGLATTRQAAAERAMKSCQVLNTSCVTRITSCSR